MLENQFVVPLGLKKRGENCDCTKSEGGRVESKKRSSFLRKKAVCKSKYQFHITFTEGGLIKILFDNLV